MINRGDEEWDEARLLEYAKARIEGCRKGGQRSAEKRRESARRRFVEIAIRDRISAGDYDRDTAGKIANYLKVSPRYVRRLASAMKKAERSLSSVPFEGAMFTGTHSHLAGIPNEEQSHHAPVCSAGSPACDAGRGGTISDVVRDRAQQ